MINISVSIGDVTTEITTDTILSFDGIDTLLNRATISALTAYKEYFVFLPSIRCRIETKRFRFEYQPGLNLL